MTTKTILIIEDDIQIGNLEQELLETAWYRCIRAYSGTEAVLLLEKTVPDLVLLDLMLPGLSEEQLLKKINPVPVIVISAITDVVHDIRTPLSAINIYVQLMEEMETDKKGRRYLSVIQERYRCLIDLVEELFAYSVVIYGKDEFHTIYMPLKNEIEISLATSYNML